MDTFYHELHDLIKHICPQMIEHYIPVIALMEGAIDQDLFGPDNCICLSSDNNANLLSVLPEKFLGLDHPEGFLSAKLLEEMLGELPEDATPDVRQILEERRDIFKQLESPEYFRTLAQQKKAPFIKEIGKSMFCMSQPLGTICDFNTLLEKGMPPEEIRHRYLHYEAQYFINELFEIQCSETEFPFTNFPPNYHKEGILPKGDRETIMSAFLLHFLNGFIRDQCSM